MPKREPGKRKMSPEQRAAGERNMSAGRKSRAKRLAENADHDRAKVRWQKLLDGQLTVKDLDDDELKRMQVRGAGGMFSSKPRALPSHLAAAMRSEWLARGQAKLERGYHDAIQIMLDIANNPDVKDSDRIKAANIVIERTAGKAVEHVHVKSDDPWGKMMADALEDARDVLDQLEDAD